MNNVEQIDSKIFSEFKILVDWMKNISGSDQMMVIAHRHPDLNFSEFQLKVEKDLSDDVMNQIFDRLLELELKLKEQTGYSWYLFFEPVKKFPDFPDRIKHRILKL